MTITVNSIRADWQHKKEIKGICPICGHKGWCYYDATGHYLRCNRPDAANLNAPGWVLYNDYGESLYFKDSYVNESDNKNIISNNLHKSWQRKKDNAQLLTPTNNKQYRKADPELINAVYNDLIHELKLSQKHKDELTNPSGKRRLEVYQIIFGLCPATVPGKNYQFKLLTKYTKEQLLSVPGFVEGENGQLKLNAGRGMLIPTQDVKGKITGMRVKADNPFKGKKYYWLSSAKYGGPKANIKCAVYTPLTGNKNPGIIGITEGELKAFITAQKLEMTVISVPGVGSWKSAEAVELALSLAGGKGNKAVIFYDQDSDPVTAANVARHALALSEALDTAGLTVIHTAWDNQGGQYKGIDDLLNAGGNFSSWVYLAGSGGLRTDKVIKQDYVTEFVPDDTKRLTNLRAPKGAGKSTWCKEYMYEAREQGVINLSLVHRVALGREQSTRYDLDFYQDTTTITERGLVITSDSLGKLDLTQLAGLKFNLYFDEIEQFLMHLTGYTMQKGQRRKTALRALEWLIRHAHKIICLDADLGLLTYNFFSELIDPEQIETVVYTGKPAHMLRKFYKYDKATSVKQKIFDQVRAGLKVAVACTSIKMATTLFEAIQKAFPERSGLLITKDTSKQHSDIIDHINNRITEYDYLIYSPSLGTGISLDVVHFDTVFVLAKTRPVTHRDILQMAGRVRRPTTNEVHCWVENRPDETLETEAAIILANMIANYQKTAIDTDFNELGERIAMPHEKRYLTLRADVESTRNLSMSDLAANFWQAVEREGHTITEVRDADQPPAASQEARQAYIEASAELKEERIAGIEAAETPLTTDYIELKAKVENGDASETERWQVERYEIETYYGITPDRELIELDNEGLLRPKIENFICWKRPDYAKERDADDLAGKNREDQAYRKLVGEARTRLLHAELRHEILQRAGFMTGNTVYSAQSLTENGFTAWAQANRARIAQTFNMRFTGTDITSVKLVNNVLRALGLTPKATQIRTETGRIREYKVELEDIERISALASLRWQVIEANEEKYQERQSAAQATRAESVTDV